MLKEERHQLILEKLRNDGKVLATELSSLLNVSEDTIRRDLRDLAEANIIQRVHGGALLRAPGTTYVNRQKQATVAKAEIAEAAVKLVRPEQVIILDGGTTTLEVARRLPLDLRATIITNSPPVAVALAEHVNIDVILLGGKLYKNSLVTVGIETVAALQSFRADLCLLGVCSLHPEIGISVPQREEAQVKRAMIASAAEVVGLATADKLNTAAPYIVGPLTELTYLITEQSVSAEILAPYRACGVTVILS